MHFFFFFCLLRLFPHFLVGTSVFVLDGASLCGVAGGVYHSPLGHSALHMSPAPTKLHPIRQTALFDPHPPEFFCITCHNIIRPAYWCSVLLSSGCFRCEQRVFTYTTATGKIVSHHHTSCWGRTRWRRCAASLIWPSLQKANRINRSPTAEPSDE